MKPGERVVFKGIELVATPWLALSDTDPCTGCALISSKPYCLRDKCGSHILVTVPEYVAMKLLGETE